MKTTKQVAEEFGVTESYLQTLLVRRRVPRPVKFAGAFVWTAADIAAARPLVAAAEANDRHRREERRRQGPKTPLTVYLTMGEQVALCQLGDDGTAVKGIRHLLARYVHDSNAPAA